MTKTSRTAVLWFRSDNRKSAIQNPKWWGLSVIVFVLVVAVAAVEAQQLKKVTRIGYLSSQDPGHESARAAGIRLALRELGYVEGQNIAIEYRYSEGKTDRAPELAAELVRLKVDISRPDPMDSSWYHDEPILEERKNKRMKRHGSGLRILALATGSKPVLSS